MTPAKTLKEACERGYGEVVAFLRNRMQPAFLDVKNERELALLRKVERDVELAEAPYGLGSSGEKEKAAGYGPNQEPVDGVRRAG